MEVEHIFGDTYHGTFDPPHGPDSGNDKYYFRLEEDGKCVSEMLTFTYDAPTGTTSNPTGVEIRNGSGGVITTLPPICSNSPPTMYANTIRGSQGIATYQWFKPGGASVGTASSLSAFPVEGTYLVEAYWDSNCTSGISTYSTPIIIS